MTEEEYDRNVETFSVEFIRACVNQLCGKFGFRRQDLEDIQQSLYLKVAKLPPTNDPDDPRWKGLVAITVRRQIATILRDREAEKRDHRRVGSLHIIVGLGTDNPIELVDAISDQDARIHRGVSYGSPQELAELRADVETCVAELPEEQFREFCARLKECGSVSQVAREMGIPRTTLNGWINKIRCRFENSGLEDYL